jgi:glutamate-ammonia-ligase adenylyltransferase
MALTRARVVTGPAALAARVRTAIAEALDGAGTGETVRADAAAMRRRLLRDKPPEGPWDVRMREGGLTDVEFISQALQLDPALRGRARHAQARRGLASLARAGMLDRAEARGLIEADRFWRTVQSSLRLLIGPKPAEPTPRLRETIGTLLGVAPSEIEARMDSTAAFVRYCFNKRVGEIDR